MLKFMLDTNIVIYVIKRKPIAVLEVFNRHVGQLCISSITLSELLHGAEKSTKIEDNLQLVEDFVSRLEVLDYREKAAAHYGDIRADLERKGTTIGVNDLHIAGHARSEGLTLVTNNFREFDRVSALRLDNWIEKETEREDG
jgi:tRNA(fMet)-specific endonuclease VapC